MKKIIVTGATGFIGKHCLPLLLDRHYEVHAVTSRAETCHPGPVAWHRADLLDRTESARLVSHIHPTHLLHLAWVTEPSKYWDSPDNQRWLDASLSLARSCLEHGARRVVMAGSCAEYDWSSGWCSENTTPLRPFTTYGRAKHFLQSQVDALARGAGTSSAWGRVFFAYGPHEKPGRLVPSVIQALLKGEPASCCHGEQTRDFLYVLDLAGAFVALLESEVQGSVNLASGQPIAILDLVNQIASKLGRSHLVRFQPAPESPTDPPVLLADIQRLSGEVGWAPRFDLDAGLTRTIEWWKHQLGTDPWSV